jgi:hypothetical protein
MQLDGRVCTLEAAREAARQLIEAARETSLDETV